ncbi:MAG: hypothetical protein K2X87_17820 [Gemmataceae bacterium]|nr:hypothetical protein [Gemmataceae bacterium]
MTATPTQREALAVIAEILAVAPDLRLGQLLAFLPLLCEDRAGRSLWDVEDDELLPVLYSHRDEMADRSPDPAVTPPG